MNTTTKRPGRNDKCHCGSGKKYKQCHERPDKLADAQTAPKAGTPTAVDLAQPEPEPNTPAAALESLRADNEAALASAKDADLDVLNGSPPVEASPIDIVAAAKLVHETLALCKARDDRLAALETSLEERKSQLDTHATELESQKRDLADTKQSLQIGQQRVHETEAGFRKREHDAQVRDEELRARELNAEAGFLKERRESLQQLDAEAAVLRNELANVRAQIAKERAAWEGERQADEQRWSEQLSAAREQLSRDRADIKRRAAQVQTEHDIIREDKEALDAIVETRAAHELEKAKLKHQALEARLTAALSSAGELDAKLRQREEADRAVGNLSPEQVKKKLDELIRERNTLKEQLAKRPTQDAADQLTTLQRAQEGWEADRARLTQESVAAKTALAKATIAVTELETLRDQKAALESARDLLHAALQELRKDVDDRIRRSDGVSPFPACSAMDTDSGLQTSTPVTESIPDLKAFCQDLQHRVAIDPSNPDKVLYYEPRDLRCFVAGLAMSRLHLLQGISGTGKTSLPLAVARALGAGSTLVEVQAGWRDRQDLVGHFNQFERRFYETEFLQALYRAKCPRYAGLVNIIVLDEMNLSHPEQYFADLLSALEQDPHLQKLDLMTAPVEPAPAHLRQGRSLAIPQNVWFVGTANHDETTKDFADKTYDRAHVMELPRNRAQFVPQRLPARAPVTFEALRQAFDKAQDVHAAKAKEAYAFLDKSFADILGRRFGVGWGNRLERQMLDFVPVVIAAGGSVGEAVDHVLATKLLRKIRDRHDTRPEDLTSLNEHIASVWPTLDKTTGARLSANIVQEELRRLGAEEDV